VDKTSGSRSENGRGESWRRISLVGVQTEWRLEISRSTFRRCSLGGRRRQSVVTPDSAESTPRHWAAPQNVASTSTASHHSSARPGMTTSQLTPTVMHEPTCIERILFSTGFFLPARLLESVHDKATAQVYTENVRTPCHNVSVELWSLR